MDLKSIMSVLSIKPPFSNLITVILDEKGNILGPADDKETYINASIWEELIDAGNIRHYFDLSPYNSLGDLPTWDPDKTSKEVNRFFNHRAFIRLEDPGRFFTTLPSAALTVLRPDIKTFIGIIRTTGNIPNISIGGAGCIVYADKKDRLIGFNENFLELLDTRPADPLTLLGRPTSRFFSPSPAQLNKKQAGLYPLRPRTDFRREYAVDFSRHGFGDIHCTDPQSLSHNAEGLACKNSTDDFIYLTPPVFVDTHKDFFLSLESRTICGFSPTAFLTRQPDPALYPQRTPDSDGYQAGSMQEPGCVGIKRKALLQQVDQKVNAGQDSLLEIFKIGNTIRLFIDGELKIEYCDFDFIHHAKARIVFGVRIKSECIFRSVSFAVAEPARSETADITPIVRFKTAKAHTALLTRINNIHLLASFPDVSAWVLENITQIEDRMAKLRQENLKLQQAVGAQAGDFIGKSPAMLTIKQDAARVAATDATILLEGPTGTGKEMLARYIHERSAKKGNPFIKVDCAVISPALMESELFGHEQGAFTGASDRHIGYFERAQGGTVFLDEAGNLSPEAQAKLLHFLQDRVITRVGGRETIELDVRVIVASNVPLRELVLKNLFREDLFFRIDVVTLALPTLAERVDDLPELCNHFLELFSQRHNKNIKTLSPTAFRKIAGYTWPGNIRELRNTIERAVLFCRSDTIGQEDIAFSLKPGVGKTGKRGPYRHGDIDMEQVKQVLWETKGNLKEAACALDIPRRTLYYKIKKSGMSADQLRQYWRTS